jgi:hypothetical protein
LAVVLLIFLLHGGCHGVQSPLNRVLRITRR